MKLNFTLNRKGFCKVAKIAENACFQRFARLRFAYLVTFIGSYFGSISHK